MSAMSLDQLTIERPATEVRPVQRETWFVVLLVLFVAISLPTWRQPVTSMPMNRNDAAFYLVLAHNLVEHGVYSHHQTEPFAPHTEWPPGVPLWYAMPMMLVGQFPLGSSQWIIHAWTWLTAALAAWLVFRFLRLFCSDSVALAITAATVFSRAFLDEAQAAFADIPALAASFFVLYEIERHFASRFPSRWRHASLLFAMSLLPLVKPYLGVVFVAYLWKVAQCAFGEPVGDNPRTGSDGCPRANAPRLAKTTLKTLACEITLVAICCLPFVAFMTYSVRAASNSGTISAVTWLTTDNAVAQREGVAAAADPKTMQEWINGTIVTARFHLVNHIATAPLPLLDRFGWSDWPAAPRWGVVGLGLILLSLGVARSLWRREAAAAAYLVSMLVVFAVLGCDSARYFVILTPLCAWMIWEGLSVVIGLYNKLFGFVDRTPTSGHRVRSDVGVRTTVPAVVFLLAVGSGLAWSRERQAATLDQDTLFQDVYSALFELRDRDDVHTLSVPYPLRELAIVETGKCVLTHSEFLSRNNSEHDGIAVLIVERTAGRAASFVTLTELHDRLSMSPFETLIRNQSTRVLLRRADGRQLSDNSEVTQP